MKIFLKKILREISPPIVVRIFNKLKIFFLRDHQTSFDGVYDDLSNIEDELPWSQNPG